jgi:hypothetical protein
MIILWLRRYSGTTVIAAALLVFASIQTSAYLLCPAYAAAASSCIAATSGSSGPVQAPVLSKTLPGSWDENWLASPSVADINGDGRMEIIAPRHSVLYVWKDDGTLLWKTAFGYSASLCPAGPGGSETTR